MPREGDYSDQPHVVGSDGPGNPSLERFQLKVVGKPYEGEPHVRFEVAGNGNQDRVGLVRHSQRKRGATDRPHLNFRRHSLTLPGFGHAPFAQPLLRFGFMATQPVTIPI